MAHLHGEMIDERFDGVADKAYVGGYVHVVRPDLTCWPLRWTIRVEAFPVLKSSTASIHSMVLAG
jgi:hypothetical protein